eukprot:564633_1
MLLVSCFMMSRLWINVIVSSTYWTYKCHYQLDSVFVNHLNSRTMTFLLIVITLLAYPIVTFGVSEGNSQNSENSNSHNSGNSGNSNQESHPLCSKANVPFTDETVALEYVKHYEQECAFNFFSGNYHGMNGFKQVYGDIGYMFNKDTVIEMDGKLIRGYMNARAKAVVGNNVATLKSMAYDIELLEWSEYEVYYKMKAPYVLKVAPSQESDPLVFVRLTWFTDGSKIIKSERDTTSSGIMGTAWVIMGHFTDGAMDTTQAISEHLGYLNDDGVDYTNDYINPIQFIFICVLCALTAFVAVFVYMLLKCALFGSRSGFKVADIHSIATHSCDDSQ